MPLSKQQYDELIARSDSQEICFMFDAAQCKDFLLNVDNTDALSAFGDSLWGQSKAVRLLAYVVEPGSLLAAIVAGFVWMGWWGLLAALGVFIFFGTLKASSARGRQGIVGPIVVFSLGLLLAVTLREHGLDCVVFIVALAVLYLSVKMLYALPVVFFSFLVRSNYALVNAVYERPMDEFNRQMGVPLMWHVEIPKSQDSE